jgi:hypothetical protein
MTAQGYNLSHTERTKTLAWVKHLNQGFLFAEGKTD